MDSRPIISRIILMGDSLSDRGKMNRRDLGCIPMRIFTDLNKSPDGRFTNGLAWDDHVAAAIADQFTIEKLEKKKKLDATEIADAIVDHDPSVEKDVTRQYSLNNDTYISYDGREFVRSYCEGGLTAHNYSWVPSYSPSRFFSRLILATLDGKRKELLAYNVKEHISAREIKSTLVIEWSGANDLITVNARPSHIEADKAVAARINNIEKLIKHGYRHFILFNLPDLSLTPRYQALQKSEQNNAQNCCLYFNTQLAAATQALVKKYPSISLELFDINSQFTNIYKRPQLYGLSRDKLKTPYSTSPDYQPAANGAIPSRGYMFWDDVHPTAEVHAVLASKFCDAYEEKYDFIVPKKVSKQVRVEHARDDSELAHYRHAGVKI